MTQQSEPRKRLWQGRGSGTTDSSEIANALARQDKIVGSSDRSFGIIFAVVFAVIAAFPLLGGERPRMWALIVAAAFLVVSLARPSLLAPLNRWWLRFGLVLHRVMNPLILGLMFFLIITPAGLLMRLFKGHPMRAKADPNAASYWVARVPPGPDPTSMRQQF